MSEQIKYKEILGLIHKFTNDPYIQHIKDRDKTQSMMEIVGVNRDENSHSDFLAWLFDSSKDHQLGALPADKLIKLVASKAPQKQELLPFLINADEIISSSSKREFAIQFLSQKGLVDILIEMSTTSEGKKIRVIFENKVNAPETKNRGQGQTELYSNYFQKEHNDSVTNIYVYNRCDASSKKPECDDFICITYQDIVDHIIEPLLQLPHLSIRTKFILKDYILALEKPAVIEKQKDKIIMAMGHDTTKLLQDFWDNNSELILQVADALALQNPQDDKFKGLADATRNARKSYSVSYNGNNYNSLSQAGECIMGELSNKINSKEVLSYIYPGTNRICQETDDFYKNNKTRFSEKPIAIDGKNFYLRKEWTGDYFKYFLEKLVEIGLIESANVTLYETTKGQEHQIYPLS